MDYTKPKIYLDPSLQGKHGSYKPKAGERIRVVWSHYHPEKGKKIEVKRSHGIRDFETLAEQKKFAKALRDAFELMLSRGYNPFETEQEAIREAILIKELEDALEQKKTTTTPTTWRGYEQSLGAFKTYLEGTNYSRITTDDPAMPKVMDLYFNKLRRDDTNPTSYNNARSSISALFSELLKARRIHTNPITVIPKLKADPQKNRPFTSKQIRDNAKWMAQNDPALQFYIQVMAYSFLRPKEVMRLRVGDIDLEAAIIRVKTKSQRTELVPIIGQLVEILKAAGIQRYPADYSVIHHSGKPAPWNVTLEHKLRLYGKRFRKLKKAAGYGDLYGVYSYRHSAALEVYKSFAGEELNHDEILLKMKSITRHRSVQGLKNYLRGLGANVAADYGDRINLDL